MRWLLNSGEHTKMFCPPCMLSFVLSTHVVCMGVMVYTHVE